MIRFECRNNIGFATLNREAALNSLNLEMAIALLKQFKAWQSDPQVKAIVLRGAGNRSFCSGGDVKQVCLSIRQNDFSYGEQFFRFEYELDELIHTYPKPIVVLGSGIVMGGGIGLMAGAQVRVVTETSMLAMPELSIGLFPDVGGSYFLNRMPEKLGLFLALTAARMNAADAIFAGLADHFIPSENLTEYLTDLERAPEKAIEITKDWAARFKAALPAPQYASLLSTISSSLESGDPSVAFAGLKGLASHNSPILAKAAQNFMNGSPTSAYVIFEQLKRGKTLSLHECFQMEYTMAVRCCHGHDFSEGVRAVLIDKDQKPHWNPSTLEGVSAELIARHFKPLNSEDSICVS
jgi:enoyl-CoA hydratase/carnithine racemase